MLLLKPTNYYPEYEVQAFEPAYGQPRFLRKYAGDPVTVVAGAADWSRLWWVAEEVDSTLRPLGRIYAVDPETWEYIRIR